MSEPYILDVQQAKRSINHYLFHCGMQSWTYNSQDKRYTAQFSVLDSDNDPDVIRQIEKGIHQQYAAIFENQLPLRDDPCGIESDLKILPVDQPNIPQEKIFIVSIPAKEFDEILRPAMDECGNQSALQKWVDKTSNGQNKAAER